MGKESEFWEKCFKAGVTGVGPILAVKRGPEWDFELFARCNKLANNAVEIRALRARLGGREMAPKEIMEAWESEYNSFLRAELDRCERELKRLRAPPRS